MRKLIVEEWVSLDSYVTDKEGGLDFFTNLTAEQNKDVDAEQLKFLETIDAILLGRKTYALFVDFWPKATTDQQVVADKLNQTNKIVFSNSLTKAPWGKWPEAMIISGEATAAIKQLKEMKGKDMVLWGSISLAQSLMSADLVDEYRLQLCPVLTGGGRALFPKQINYGQLQLMEVRKYDFGTLFMNYQRIR